MRLWRNSALGFTWQFLFLLKKLAIMRWVIYPVLMVLIFIMFLHVWFAYTFDIKHYSRRILRLNWSCHFGSWSLAFVEPDLKVDGPRTSVAANQSHLVVLIWKWESLRLYREALDRCASGIVSTKGNINSCERKCKEVHLFGILQLPIQMIRNALGWWNTYPLNIPSMFSHMNQ